MSLSYLTSTRTARSWEAAYPRFDCDSGPEMAPMHIETVRGSSRLIERTLMFKRENHRAVVRIPVTLPGDPLEKLAVNA